MKPVKVSIGVLSYNNAAYLPIALDSILSQSYEDFEVVIVDDGSSDESLNIARKYEAADKRVKVFTHQNNVNRGISATCNLAISKSQGEYIALSASDDAYYPYTIAEQVKVLEENPSVGLVCGTAQMINAQGELLSETFGVNIWSDSDYLKKIVDGNVIAAPTVMVRKVCYEQVGLFDEEILYNDYELWLRLLLFSDWKIKFIDKELALYRMHNTNVSRNNSTKKECNLNLAVYLKIDKLLKESGKNEKLAEYKILKYIVSQLYLNLFYCSAQEGNLPEAMQYLKSFFAYHPRSILKPQRFLLINYRLAQSFIISLTSTFKNGGQSSS